MRTFQLLAVIVALLVGAAACGGGEERSSSVDRDAGGAAPFDRAFIDAMVPHHRSAIEMARVATQAGLSQPDLVGIARDVVSTQQREIDQMLAWRRVWYGSAKLGPVDGEALGLSLAEMGMSHGASELADSHDVDAEFATMMIDHHEGAVRMAKLALERSERPKVRDLAREIIEAQEREIAVMKKHAAGGHHP